MGFPFVNKTFQIAADFQWRAKELFQYQHQSNIVYKKWCDCLNIHAENVCSTLQIPFLPISFFKTHKVLCGDESYEVMFESSGTTRSNKSRHYIWDINLYVQSFIKGFEIFYGHIKEWCIIGLLPSYLQQQNSSLIKMIDDLVKLSCNDNSGFYLDEFEQLNNLLKHLEKQKQKTLLIGVTYALLDFAEKFPMQLSSTIIMETGGMKGRRKELTRNEVHHILKKQFQVHSVHSEYGMTELLSQAYSKGGGRFYCPPWMKVLVRNEDDPLLVKTAGKGALNIVLSSTVGSEAWNSRDLKSRPH